MNLRKLSFVLLLGACTGAPSAPSDPEPTVDGTPQATADAVPEKVQKAVTVGKAIQAAPEDAASILSDNGMTAEEFEALLYEIAEDPALASAYAAGMRG